MSCPFVAYFSWTVFLSSNAKSLPPSFVKQLFSEECEFSSTGRYFSLPKGSEDASNAAHGKKFFCGGSCSAGAESLLKDNSCWQSINMTEFGVLPRKANSFVVYATFRWPVSLSSPLMAN